ncbi:hypothetical protein GCM10023350_25450 [Nocardioides endophyticus]|uniref:Carrier domain-containing protein n=2 Tax=Nocardioides endophyticus TaxID=1353775 RepID=A0ABP8YWT6_9ACTN
MPETRAARAGPTHTGRTRMGVMDVQDQFDVSLEDSDLLGEVELTTNLIIAASESDEHLSVDEIDRILGVVPSPRSEA